MPADLIETAAEIARQGYALDVSAEEVARAIVLATLTRMRDGFRGDPLLIEAIASNFAEQHGLEMPAAAPPGALGGPSGSETDPGARRHSDTILDGPGGAGSDLPIYRTPGGHAA